MTFETYFADHLRVRWQRLHLYHFPSSVLTGYRILKNFVKTNAGDKR